MDKALSDSVAVQFRSAFPDGTFTQVDVLEYGDDPDVEPGETAIRAFVDRVGRPAGTFQDDEEVMRSFEEAHRQPITWLHRDGRLPSIAWIQLIPDSRHPRQAGPGRCLVGLPKHVLRNAVRRDGRGIGVRRRAHRLGPADLATVDALISAGIAPTRGEVLRWAIDRIRENPAYAQIQERGREISELREQF